MIVSKTNRDGIDRVVESLQQNFYPQLLGAWVDESNYEMLPRANKSYLNSDIIPELYIDEKDCQSTLYNDNYDVSSFFVAGDEEKFQYNTQDLRRRLSIVFQCDLVELYGESERLDEVFKADVLRVLKKPNEYIVSDTIDISIGVDNVYSDFSISNELKDRVILDDKSNRHVIKFSFDVRYGLDCSKTIVPFCRPVSIYQNDVFERFVNSGGDFYYYTTADPVVLNINSEFFTNIPSGETFDLEVVDADGNETGGENDGQWIVPFSGSIYYNKAIYLRDVSSYDYDEAYWKARGINDYMLSIPDNAIFQQLDLLLKDRLVYNNMHGNKFRFSGIEGGYYNPDDGLYYDRLGVLSSEAAEFPTYNGISFFIVDHYNGFLFIGVRGGSANYESTMSLIDSRNGTVFYDYMTGFSAPSSQVIAQLFDSRYANNLYNTYRPPFKFDQATHWTCSVSPNSSSFCIRYSCINDELESTSKVANANRMAYKHNYLTGTVQNTTINDD